MLDAREIEMEIARLEYLESSYPNYAKLADLYTIQNQMNKNAGTEEQATPYSSVTAEEYEIGDYGDSDFLQAVSHKDAYDVWVILDDLMDTLKVVNQRAYNRIMNRINAL